MFVEESLIIEVDMPDNPKVIGDNANFIGIAKMAVDIELPDIRVRSNVGRHGTGNLENIWLRKLIVWYHISATPFRWIWLIVILHLNFTINL